MELYKNGLYNIYDKYFTDFKSKFFMDNKSENRPYYYLFKDEDNILWVIPLSTQIENYKDKINRDENLHKQCIFYHIGKIGGNDRVFLIGNMFPVTAEYIKKPFTISGTPYIVKDKNLISEINKRAKRYLSLVKQGKLQPNVNIMEIKNEFKNN